MKAKELIRILSEWDGDTEVLIDIQDESYFPGADIHIWGSAILGREGGGVSIKAEQIISIPLTYSHSERVVFKNFND